VSKLDFSRLFSSLKTSKLNFVIPVFFTILIAIVFSQLVLLSQPYNKDALFLIFNYEIFSPLNLFLMAISIVAILFLFLRAVKTGREIVVRILVSFYILAGCYSLLLIGRLVFVMSGSDSQLLLLVPAAATFVGMFGAFLVFIDSISRKARNRLFVISTGAFGALMGVLVPTPFVLGGLVMLSIADTILILNKSIQRTFGETKYEELLQQLTFSTRDWGIGIGDLICYSIIGAHTSVYFGVYAGTISLVLILLGSFVTIKAAAKRSRFPGLPVPIALGLLPSIILLLLP
jgi:hypothetical protein